MTPGRVATVGLNPGPNPGTTLACLAVALIAAVAAPHAPGQEYPARAIRLATGGAPGGLSDLSTRITAQGLSEQLGQPVVVENRPGAMTMIANESVSRAVPDGYTLLFGASEGTMLPYLKKSAASFDPLKDLTPIARVLSSWGAYVVSPKLPVRNLPDLIAYAKANPGKVRYGTNGVGGAQHFAVLLLEMKADIQLLLVPYKSTAQVGIDTLSGQLDMASMGLASAVANQGKLVVVAQTGPTRHPSLAEVPTTAELGFPEVRVDIWFGLMGPPGLPPAIVARLATAVDALLRKPAVQSRLAAMGSAPMYLPPQAFAEYILEEKKKWARLIPAWNIPMEN